MGDGVRVVGMEFPLYLPSKIHRYLKHECAYKNVPIRMAGEVGRGKLYKGPARFLIPLIASGENNFFATTERILMPRKIQKYGWSPDLPDHRDHIYAAPSAILPVLPPKVDLRSQCPPVVDQGQLGSCTANSIGNAHRFDQMKQGVAQNFMPSRLFIYYNERAMEGTVGSDSGGQIRDGIKSIAQKGVCPEIEWPYVVSKFKSKPPAACFKAALKHQAVSSERVTQDLSQMKGCLASGYPFVFGFTVYDSFESQAVAKSGVVPMPKKGEKTVGGHAVLCVGYDDASKRFIVMNSWSVKWGQKGFFTIPYDYLTNSNLADDFWTVRTVEV